MSLRRGFVKEAEQIAADIRGELGIGSHERLDPFSLATHLAVPALGFGGLRESLGFSLNDPIATRLASHVRVLTGEEGGAVSALTMVYLDGKSVILYNDSHSAGRQASSICHEISHCLLFHTPQPALDNLGCRMWDTTAEAEADRLSGALLIPSDAAWRAVSRGMDENAVALHFGTSIEMARWRINLSGARKVLRSRVSVH